MVQAWCVPPFYTIWPFTDWNVLEKLRSTRSNLHTMSAKMQWSCIIQMILQGQGNELASA